MLSFICPLLYLICATGFLVLISKRTFGKCLPLTMMLSAFSYFASQVLFKTFKVGFAVNIIMAAAFIVIIIWKLIRKQNLKEIKTRFFSQGFFAFLAIFTFIFLFDMNRVFSVWDEWSHWGPMVKEMMRLDRFYSVDASILAVHKGYPPIVQLMELFFCTLQGGFNGYKEAYLLRSVHLFNFSLLIPAIFETDGKYNKFKLMLKTILFFACAYFIVLLFDQHTVINTVYLDYTMASLTAYLLAQVLFEKEPLSWPSLIGMSIGLSFLTLTKQVALAMVAMVVFMFVLNLFIKKELKLNKIFTKKSLLSITKVIILLIVVPLIFWKGWSYYISHFNFENIYKLSDIKINELQSIIKGESGEEWQQQAATNYMTAIKTNNLTTSNVFHFSYFQCMIIVLLMLYLVWKLGGNKIFQKYQISLAAITLIIGMIGYAFMMLVLYVFNFGPGDGPILASFNRYIPTYIIICGLFVLYIFIYVNSKNDVGCKNFASILILLSGLLIVQNPLLIEKIKPASKPTTISNWNEAANDIISKTNEDDKIFIITYDVTIGASYFIQYYTMPRAINFEHYNFSTIVTDNYEQYFYDEINDYMLEYDYLYLQYIDDTILNNFAFLFAGNENVKVGQLYKIINNNGKVTLKLVS